MKTLIIALNSKYIHSTLAPWYLKACCGEGCGGIKVSEYTINDQLDSILASINREKVDVAAFSCYIWNIGQVLKLAGDLKKVSPGLVIVLGGPEVSYDAGEMMHQNEAIDFILSGEGEMTFKQLLEHLNNRLNGQDFQGLADIGGLKYRQHGQIISNKAAPFIGDLDSIPSPYTDEMLAGIKNRIVYFESSRGCPFSCTYCLSSTFEGVRYFSLDRVKRDITKLAGMGFRQVKFVDRTFNCHKQRAKEIFRFIIELKADQAMNFHFEAAADLFDEEMLQILAAAPEGLIQLEIGIQSVNGRSLDAVKRRTSMDQVFANVHRLHEAGNINLHLDLIAGLPFEDFESFKTSFNGVYSLKPHQLQLGFLKLLKGSEIRHEACLHGYRFRDYPPYEVLANSYISFDELTELKGIEELVERYYNSGRFVRTLEYIVHSHFESAFYFFYAFSRFNLERGYLDAPVAGRELYAILYDFVSGFTGGDRLEAAGELMKLDFLASDPSGNPPLILRRQMSDGFKDKCFDFLKDQSNLELHLMEFKGVPAKQIFKKVHFEPFSFDVTANDGDFSRKIPTVILFNYNNRNKVTGLFHYQAVSL